MVDVQLLLLAESSLLSTMQDDETASSEGEDGELEEDGSGGIVLDLGGLLPMIDMVLLCGSNNEN